VFINKRCSILPQKSWVKPRPWIYKFFTNITSGVGRQKTRDTCTMPAALSATSWRYSSPLVAAKWNKS
jgi:hypothetical protein